MELIFYLANQGDFWDKLIGWWTGGPYSHVELVFSNGECFTSSPRDGGVRFKQIDINPEHWNRVSITVAAEKEAEIYTWCESQVGLKYDWLGILGFVLPIHFRTRRAWYCSEICSYVLDRFIGHQLPLKISPNGLYTLLEKTI